MQPRNLTPLPPRGASGVRDSSETPVPLHPRRILVAEDELLRQLISSVLVDDGFAVDTAADGQEAWEALRDGHYDLLVTDNEMPRLAGLELIERIRKEGLNLPVIVASGSCSAERTRNDPQLRVAAVLSKPFDLFELVRAVRLALQALGRGASADQDGFAPIPREPATDPLMQPNHHRIMHTIPDSFDDWCQSTSPISHREAAFPNPPLPLTVEQPSVANAVPKRILIADDDSLVRRSLAAVLESEGYVVDEARNGFETVTRAIAHAPDLVLLDLQMPHWDGWTAFSQLDRVTPLLPVIVITARPNQYEKAVRLGVDAFMEKPLNIPVLVRAIKRLASEDEGRHVARITKTAFVTQLLENVAA
jgi:CheY-like chemotaxis protein